MEAFEIKDLTFTYPNKDEPALKGVNISAQHGEFITICGKSGCGKSTLLRNLKPALAPHGMRSGEIIFNGKPLSESSLREQTQKIGFVMQNPDNQIVTDKVWHELAFGLESLGYDTKTIRLRVAEMASFFGIQNWFLRNVSELSGGQKQLLNLASIMAMQPDILLLDEPTSQLDPIAAVDFLETVKKINREIGTTIILSEHRLEEVLQMSDRVIVLDNGSVLIDDEPQKVGTRLAATNHAMFCAMPSPMQICATVIKGSTDNAGCDLLDESAYCAECPITVREGRKWLSELFADRKTEIRVELKAEMKAEMIVELEAELKAEIAETLAPAGGKADINKAALNFSETPVLELKETWFKYEKNDVDVIKGLSIKIFAGQIHSIVGGNGTGKTTALSLLSGINKPYRGKAFVKGKETAKYKSQELFNGILGVLPQNPQALFVEKTVELDLLEILEGKPFSNVEKLEKINAIAELTQIKGLLKAHPYDLSGGEQQRAALAKVLLLEPQILLLDEPTKGIDVQFKAELARILRSLSKKGIAIVVVSHDIEFCAKYSDLCSMFFEGSIITTNVPDKFFAGNSFYTTAANRMSRHIFKNAVTTDEVSQLCLANLKR